jgi:hypothetical protein
VERHVRRVAAIDADLAMRILRMNLAYLVEVLGSE